MWDPTQLALVREAGIAGSSLSAGLASLRQANYANVGLYSHAFFSLSIGFERFLKLLYILDHLITFERFPIDNDLKKIGHDIEKLFAHAQTIRGKYKVSVSSKIEVDSIEAKIVHFLGEFAQSTRYYNLDFITGSTRSKEHQDPIVEWHETIGQAILEKHLTPRRAAKIERNADLIDQLVGDHTMVFHTAEDGTPLDNVMSASYQTGVTDLVRKYGTFYCARLCRYFYQILWELRHQAHSKSIGVPYLDELFFPFNNDDAYLLSRKTFPPRG